MNDFPAPTAFKYLLLTLLVALLSSCAPAPSLAPSGALKQQLAEIKQEQQRQAAQLQQLQQQLSQYQQQPAVNQRAETPEETLEKGDGTIIPPTPVAVPPVTGQYNANRDVADVAASASSYLAAFSNLATGNAAAAETGFTNFLRQYPDHQYAPNARYWLANAQLEQSKPNQAIATLKQIITDPKAQTKAPAALLQLAQIYRQAGLSVQADNVLEQLRESYPDSPEAQQLNKSDKPAN